MKLAALLAALPLLAAVPARAQDTERAPALELYQAGLETLLSDPRDAGLLRALGMLEPRLRELLEQADDDVDLSPAQLALLLDLLWAPKSLAAGLGDWSNGPGPSAFWGQLAFDAPGADGEERAAAWGELLEAWLAGELPATPTPVEGEPGLARFDLGEAAAFLGVRPLGAGGRLLASWGEPLAEAPDPRAFGLPEGVTPRVAARFDMGGLRTAIDYALEDLGEEAETVRQQLRHLGLSTEHPVGVEFASGVGDGRLHYVMRQRGWVQMMDTLGAHVTQTLEARDLRMIPADATLGSLSKADLRAGLRAVRAQAEDEDPFAMIRAVTGIDVDQDLLGPLGKTFGFYLSDTTGGGGPLSAVLFASVSDPERLGASFDRITELIRGLGAAQADGYVSVRDWTYAGAACRSLVTPGLPIPLEPSLGVHDGYLFVTLTPGALAAAIEHAAGDDPGLTATPRFRAVSGHDLGGLQGLSFSDTPRMIRDGYPVLAMLYSALANGVRSNRGDAREPGLILPTYPTLLAGSVPNVTLSRVQGEDLVTRGQGDPSFTAQLAGLIGSPIWSVVSWGFLAGAVVPKILEKIESDQAPPVREASPTVELVERDIRFLHSVVREYAAAHGGEAPPDLETLLTEDEAGVRYLQMDTVPLDPWGRTYLYAPPSVGAGGWRIYTLGADGTPGGEGEDSDVDNGALGEHGEH